MSPSLITIIALTTIILVLVVYLWFKRRKRKHFERLDAIKRLYPEVNSAFVDFIHYFSYGHYITESERRALDKLYMPLYRDISGVIHSRELADSPKKDSFQRLYNALSDTSGHKQVNNRHFIENQLSQYKHYFDTVLAYPLDQQQREAIVSLEDNVLVISSAGSGKTMTTVGKVRYLIDVQNADPTKILLITFTRKAAESLSERLGEKKLKCRTFHKLALDIIAEATGEKPTITDQDFSIQVYHKLFNENHIFHQAIADYIIRARYRMKSQFDYASLQDYMQDRQKYGVQAFFKDMDGKPVFCKSDEESQICDFLGSRGIKFRYEEKYEYATVDRDYRQYCPDFSIYTTGADGKPRRIYLEHFAVYEQNLCPAFFSALDEQKYLVGMKWKR